MGGRRLKAAVLEWLAIASASAAVACLIGWGASIATPKAGFTITFPSEFGLSVSGGALEFGQGLCHMREVESYDNQGIAHFLGLHIRRNQGWRLPGLRHRSYTSTWPGPGNGGYWSITSVSLLYPGVLFGLAAWLLVRSYRRISRPSPSIVHE